jgi:hypothetical protein
MKRLKKGTESGESGLIKKTAQRGNNRTKTVRTFLSGRPGEINAALPSLTDLLTALQFGESILGSALLLSERLNRVSGDSATREIGETLKHAQSNFEAFRARALGQPARSAL